MVVHLTKETAQVRAALARFDTALSRVRMVSAPFGLRLARFRPLPARFGPLLARFERDPRTISKVRTLADSLFCLNQLLNHLRIKLVLSLLNTLCQLFLRITRVNR